MHALCITSLIIGKLFCYTRVTLLLRKSIPSVDQILRIRALSTLLDEYHMQTNVIILEVPAITFFTLSNHHMLYLCKTNMYILHMQAQKEGGIDNVRRDVSWMEGHVGKDGKVHPPSFEAYGLKRSLWELQFFYQENSFKEISHVLWDALGCWSFLCYYFLHDVPSSNGVDASKICYLLYPWLYFHHRIIFRT